MVAAGVRAMARPKAAFSYTVFHGSRPKCWNTMATPGGGPATGSPLTTSRPPDRSVRPAMQRSSVVLPQPLGPTTHRISWAVTARLSWWNATTVPSRNTLLAFSATMAASFGRDMSTPSRPDVTRTQHHTMRDDAPHPVHGPSESD